MMDPAVQTIIFSILIPAAVSWIATRLTYSFQKRTDYEYDYRKHLLEKRKAAYDKMDSFIFRLPSLAKPFDTEQEENERKVNFRSKRQFFRSNIDDIMQDAFWIDALTIDVMTRIMATVIELDRQLSSSDDFEQRQEQWNILARKFRLAVSDLRQRYFIDITHLSDIKRFIRDSHDVA